MAESWTGDVVCLQCGDRPVVQETSPYAAILASADRLLAHSPQRGLAFGKAA